MRTLILALLAFFRAALMPRTTLALENAALRQQLTIYLRTQRRARLRASDRAFWVALHRLWPDWTRPLVIVKPETVIGWHRKGFRLFWRRRSRPAKIGRPRIPRRHISFIKRISGDHPEWGEDRIAEELAAKFGIEHSPSTIRRYMVPRQGPSRGDQTWRTFVRNHAKEIWACDFLTQYTALFAVVYIFVVMEIGSRRIVLASVTTNPTLSWVKQQFRQATAWDVTPRFLVHDNDGIFGQCGKAVSVARGDRRRSYRCHLDRWLDEVIGIEGIPIPYGAPNASPHVERLVRTLREEALDHFIFLTTDHIRRAVAEYVRYYNGARPSQAIHGIPDPYPELKLPPPRAGKLLALPILGGVQHDYRLVA
ncbi:MAG: integrase core domain-containing protein [Candidatus Eisenbacteria sp.]|nr:integrase core domain-containing protein [Candidatus Eisenbacteria bacterium]